MQPIYFVIFLFTMFSVEALSAPARSMNCYGFNELNDLYVNFTIHLEDFERGHGYHSNHIEITEQGYEKENYDVKAANKCDSLDYSERVKNPRVEWSEGAVKWEDGSESRRKVVKLKIGCGDGTNLISTVAICDGWK